MEGGHVQLRSQRLGRPVIPYLSSAHPYFLGNSAVYRFLCSLQGKGKLASYGWAWGMFDRGCRILPRVRLGRTILAPRQWNLEKRDYATLIRAKTDTELRAAMRTLREQMGLPATFVLQMGDESLELDPDNTLELETFAQLVRNYDEITLVEPLNDAVVRGEGGSYTNQIMLPLVRRATAAALESEAAVRAVTGARRAAQHFPGRSNWLYLKLYASASTVDRLVVEELGSILEAARALTRVTRWHFVRYSDPGHHLRLRLYCPAADHREVTHAVSRALRRFLDADLVHRVQLDTYAPEYTRYGGVEGVTLMERFAHADSEAIVALLAQAGDATIRWQAALLGLHTMLEDFEVPIDHRVALLESLRTIFLAEHGAGDAPLRRIGEQFRGHRGPLERMISGAALAGELPELASAQAAFRARSRKLRPLAQRVETLHAQGKSVRRAREVLVSHLHMHVNRIMPSRQRSYELVLYDYLRRLYESAVARRSKITGR